MRVIFLLIPFFNLRLRGDLDGFTLLGWEAIIVSLIFTCLAISSLKVSFSFLPLRLPQPSPPFAP
jgi:hypothetical protein